jgi:rapamycin-insensitive companion of mTOR
MVNSDKLRIANLLNCYLITLVQLLIDCDLFKILVELSGLEDPQITVPAQKFLKQLTILMFNSLPNSSKYIDFLISSVTQDHEASVSLKSCSSFVINKIGNYVFDQKPKQQNIKLLSEL